MSGFSATALPIQRSILAVVLCVLAFLFAFEAKLAWYSPASDASSQVSAAKALRVDAPDLVSHGASAPDRALALAAFSAIAILIALRSAVSDGSPERSGLSGHLSVYFPDYLISPIESRPPPAR
jgi:hypothetical protein